MWTYARHPQHGFECCEQLRRNPSCSADAPRWERAKGWMAEILIVVHTATPYQLNGRQTFCRYLPEWEKHGITWPKARKSESREDTEGFSQKARTGFYRERSKGHSKGRNLSALGNGVACKCCLPWKPQKTSRGTIWSIVYGWSSHQGGQWEIANSPDSGWWQLWQREQPSLQWKNPFSPV